MQDKRQDFSDKISVIMAVGLVVLSLIVNSFFRDDSVDPNVITEIRFPAYETEYREINSAMPFVVNNKLPEGWSLSYEGDEKLFPEADLYSPYYIYNGDVCIGYIGFNIFTPPAENTDIKEYHKAVIPVVNADIPDYTIVRLTQWFEAGYCTLSDGEKTADAIICFNKDIHTMAGIVLTEGVADETTLQQICLSLSFSAM
jgi:hypothetical protein